MGVHFRENEEKITMGMIIGGIIIIGLLMTSLIVYLISVNKTKVQNNIAKQEQQVADDSQDEEENFEEVSIDVGKTVNEVSNEMNSTATNTLQDNQNTNKVNTQNSMENNTVTEKKNTDSEKKTNTVESKESNSKKEETKNIKFTSPIKGEIIREFASDSLVYSNTLDEWVTHNGVDIKADKTSVVKSAAEGTVYAIKNDPRYGLTVIVEHNGGYKTVYANLLTAEYVVEGEKLEVGQTIGTVGNSSAFEVSDDYHLHFEVIKDGEYLNPGNFMEF